MLRPHRRIRNKQMVGCPQHDDKQRPALRLRLGQPRHATPPRAGQPERLLLLSGSRNPSPSRIANTLPPRVRRLLAPPTFCASAPGALTKSPNARRQEERRSRDPDRDAQHAEPSRARTRKGRTRTATRLRRQAGGEARALLPAASGRGRRSRSRAPLGAATRCRVDPRSATGARGSCGAWPLPALRGRLRISPPSYSPSSARWRPATATARRRTSARASATPR